MIVYVTTPKLHFSGSSFHVLRWASPEPACVSNSVPHSCFFLFPLSFWGLTPLPTASVSLWDSLPSSNSLYLSESGGEAQLPPCLPQL